MEERELQMTEWKDGWEERKEGRREGEREGHLLLASHGLLRLLGQGLPPLLLQKKGKRREGEAKGRGREA
jgi:hypothetical protein